MLCSSINFDNLPSSISEFFTREEFDKISEYEKQHLSNLRQNFEALRRAGLPVTPPEFMLRNKSEKEKRKLVTPTILESSDGSDSEWTPALEKPRISQVNQRKRLFQPPKKAPSKDNSNEKVPGPTQQKKQRKEQTDSEDEDEEVHVYPFRKIRMSSYMSLSTPDDDDYLYCEECRQEYDGDCPIHGPLLLVDDAEVQQCPGESIEYSKRTLPVGLVIKRSKIPHAGLGVFALKDFPARTRFGPYKGKKEVDETIAHESGYSWQIMKDGQTSHFVDGKDPSRSNWMRYVNCARHEDEQCVTAYQYQGDIYYRSHKPICAGTEILVYYGDSYARDLGINSTKPERKQHRAKKVQESSVDAKTD
ncbi:unnamed protein product, partial [Candidula unifasciata]